MSLAGAHRAQHRFVLPHLSLEMAGLFAALIGAWAGIVAYVGPAFGFSADGSGAWRWTFAHTWLFLAPGAVAFLAAMLTMVAALGDRQSLLALSGLLVLACGAWLIIGPIAWPVLEGSGFFDNAAQPSSMLALEYWVGYALGPGALLVALGAFILGRDRLESRAVSSATTSERVSP